MCCAGTAVASWFVTQEVVGSNTAFLQIYFSNSTDSVDSVELIHLGKTPLFRALSEFLDPLDTSALYLVLRIYFGYDCCAALKKSRRFPLSQCLHVPTGWEFG